MLSSTSNSNERIPNLSYRKLWISVIILLVTSILAWNYHWFKEFFLPMPANDAELWSYTRRKIPKESKNTIVLIGASRIELGIDEKLIFKETGIEPIPLAIFGESMVPVLEHFAKDESFNGTIISGFVEEILVREVESSGRKFMVDEWLEFYEKHQDKTFNEDLEFTLRSLSAYLVARPLFGDNVPDRIFNVYSGKFNSGRKNVLHFNRTFKLDYSWIPNEALAEMRNEPIKELKRQIRAAPLNSTNFPQLVEKIEQSVQKIQKRGGKVIFVKMPISGELRALNNQAYPRKKFWDFFADKTSARTINFEDYPTLNRFECPDGSHLSSEDATLFTKGLVDIIFNDPEMKAK